jgi:hypothetical protein
MVCRRWNLKASGAPSICDLECKFVHVCMKCCSDTHPACECENETGTFAEPTAAHRLGPAAAPDAR